MKDLIENLPSIIEASASSQLGIVSLLILAVSIIAYLFFRKESGRVRLIVFFCLFLSMNAMAFTVIQNVPDEEENKEYIENNPVPELPVQLSIPVIETETVSEQSTRDESSNLTEPESIELRWEERYGTPWEE